MKAFAVVLAALCLFGCAHHAVSLAPDPNCKPFKYIDKAGHVTYQKPGTYTCVPTPPPVNSVEYSADGITFSNGPDADHLTVRWRLTTKDIDALHNLERNAPELTLPPSKNSVRGSGCDKTATAFTDHGLADLLVEGTCP